MTVESSWTEEEDEGAYSYEVEGEEETEDEGGFGVVPVRVVFTENEQLAPSYCSCMTWPVGQVNVSIPTQILPRKEKRYKAKFIVNFPGAGNVILNTKLDPLTLPSPQGFTFTVTAAGNFALPEYDAMQPMYIIASIAGVTISVWDESYGNVSG